MGYNILLKNKRRSLKVNKGELIDKVANEIVCTKVETKIIVKCIFKNITDCLAKGDVVRLVSFGTFGIRKRDARMARNPRTGEKIYVPAMSVPFFKAGKELKEKVK
jgi:nucleoid DNA-binding protein